MELGRKRPPPFKLRSLLSTPFKLRLNLSIESETRRFFRASSSNTSRAARLSPASYYLFSAPLDGCEGLLPRGRPERYARPTP
ncbi:uncharacterized protein CTRU02_215516 [Colletotrichum truncatum]|uniref:Uncharacterized protein n=1 Tax=Colletotrichum truncatum TaxID=5467 RepID=A0ACC3YCP2_COLTU|nr:uncharacterized protein CTRU02_05539 [Colletotrichum truncatum]KAF6793982.1 hypothetical protein CTRU02_05539 [Colletotrichum truncatum]